MGDVVNLENDCVGKYVERLLACSPELAGETVRQSASAVSPYVEKANGAASQKAGRYHERISVEQRLLAAGLL